MNNDHFFNFVKMVPGFLHREEFDEMLYMQIQVLKAKYK